MKYQQLIDFINAGNYPAPPSQYKLGQPLAFYGFRDGSQPAEPGAAMLCVEDNFLKAYGAFFDSDIYNNASEDNAETWLSGDVFEIFFQVKNREDYYEAHTTPEMVRLQLHIQDYRTFRGIPHEEKLEDFKIEVKTRVFHDQNRWLAEIKIPFNTIGLNESLLNGSKFVFARYNYTRGEGSPVISSSMIFPATAHYPPLWHVIS